METAAPIRADTLFPICSVTKSFTVTGLALLADEGFHEPTGTYWAERDSA
jgi:CubicO group peptidase (beta-lactamase class C family)